MPAIIDPPQLVRETDALAMFAAHQIPAAIEEHAGYYGNPEEEHTQPGKFRIKIARGSDP